jgi:hypothetical protein
MTLAPIVLFTYKRLDTLKLTVEAIKNNDLAAESDLYVYSDAAKCLEDQEAISHVRAYIQSIDGFKTITIYESKSNKGLASSIIEGVSQVLEVHQTVIVLEDDLVTSSNFLTFMNSALIAYYENQKVFSVSGYGLKVAIPQNYEYDVYFTPRGMSWGWATWKDRWDNVDWDVKDFKEFQVNKKEKSKFAIGGTDLNAMLKKQIDGKIDSWAIRWYYNQSKNNQLTVFPLESKVINLGFDDMATHTNAYNRYDVSFDILNKKTFIYPDVANVHPVIFKSFKRYFGISSRIFYGRIISPLFRIGQSLRKLLKMNIVSK